MGADFNFNQDMEDYLTKRRLSKVKKIDNASPKPKKSNLFLVFIALAALIFFGLSFSDFQITGLTTIEEDVNPPVVEEEVYVEPVVEEVPVIDASVIEPEVEVSENTQPKFQMEVKVTKQEDIGKEQPIEEEEIVEEEPEKEDFPLLDIKIEEAKAVRKGIYYIIPSIKLSIKNTYYQEFRPKVYVNIYDERNPHYEILGKSVRKSLMTLNKEETTTLQLQTEKFTFTDDTPKTIRITIFDNMNGRFVAEETKEVRLE